MDPLLPFGALPSDVEELEVEGMRALLRNRRHQFSFSEFM